MNEITNISFVLERTETGYNRYDSNPVTTVVQKCYPIHNRFTPCREPCECACRTTLCCLPCLLLLRLCRL